jgi:hypothetical protein
VLGAAYRRKSLPKGGISNFVHEKYNYLNADVSKFCKDQNIEACALKLQLTALDIYVVTVYRAPCGNFISFLNGLDSIIKSLCKAELNLIICGDINIDYLTDNERRKQLDAMLLSYNLAATAHFLTRIQNQSCRAVGNAHIAVLPRAPTRAPTQLACRSYTSPTTPSRSSNSSRD